MMRLLARSFPVLLISVIVNRAGFIGDCLT